MKNRRSLSRASLEVVSEILSGFVTFFRPCSNKIPYGRSTRNVVTLVVSEFTELQSIQITRY